MAVPNSEVGCTSATARRGDHEISYEHVVASEEENFYDQCFKFSILYCNNIYIIYIIIYIIYYIIIYIQQYILSYIAANYRTIQKSPSTNEENGLFIYKRALYEHIFIEVTYL